MRYFDTHAHFEDADDVAALFSRAAAAGVERILAVGGSDELNRNALKSPQPIALGLDRDQVSNGLVRLPELESVLAQNASRLAAIGEIGLDCHYAAETLPAQVDLFSAQLELADRLARPVIIHTREADDATLSALDSIPWHHAACRGVIHSFTGAPSFAAKLLDRGFMISFSGIATFRLAENVRESVRFVPVDRMLAETDSPYLAPVPLRGQRCEPAFVTHTVARLAQEKGIPLESFAETLFQTATFLFG